MFRLENVKRRGSLLCWVISTETPNGGRQYWNLISHFGAGLYCDMASNEDVAGFPTKLYNLVLFT